MFTLDMKDKHVVGARNAVTAIDRHLFSGSFTGAIDGNETGACTAQGEALRDFAEERRSMRRAS